MATKRSDKEQRKPKLNTAEEYRERVLRSLGGASRERADEQRDARAAAAAPATAPKKVKPAAKKPATAPSGNTKKTVKNDGPLVASFNAESVFAIPTEGGRLKHGAGQGFAPAHELYAPGGKLLSDPRGESKLVETEPVASRYGATKTGGGAAPKAAAPAPSVDVPDTARLDSETPVAPIAPFFFASASRKSADAEVEGKYDNAGEGTLPGALPVPEADVAPEANKDLTAENATEAEAVKPEGEVTNFEFDKASSDEVVEKKEETATENDKAEEKSETEGKPAGTEESEAAPETENAAYTEDDKSDDAPVAISDARVEETNEERLETEEYSEEDIGNETHAEADEYIEYKPTPREARKIAKIEKRERAAEAKSHRRDERLDAEHFADYSAERDLYLADNPRLQDRNGLEGLTPEQAYAEGYAAALEDARRRLAEEQRAAKVEVPGDAPMADDQPSEEISDKKALRRDVKAFKKYNDDRDSEVAAAVAANAAAAAVKSRDNAPYDAPKIDDPLIEATPAPKAEKVDKRVLRGEALIAAEEELRDMLTYPEYYAARDKEIEELKAIFQRKKEEAEEALLAKKHTYDAPEADDPIVEEIKIEETDTAVDKKAIRADAKAFKKYSDERDAEVAAAVAANADALAALKAKNTPYNAPAIDDPIVEAVKAEPEAPVGKKALRADAKGFDKYNGERDAEVAAAVAANAAAQAAVKSRDNAPYEAPQINDPLFDATTFSGAEKVDKRVLRGEALIAAEEELRDMLRYPEYYAARDREVEELRALAQAKKEEAEAALLARTGIYDAPAVDDPIVEAVKVDEPDTTVGKKTLRADAKAFKKYNDERDAEVAAAVAANADALAALKVKNTPYSAPAIDDPIIEAVKAEPEAPVGKKALRADAKAFKKYNDERDAEVAAAVAANADTLAALKAKNTPYNAPAIDDPIVETVKAEPEATVGKKALRADAKAFKKYNDERDAEVAAAVAANADALAALKAKNTPYNAPAIDDPIVEAVKAEPETTVGKKALRADAKAFKKYNDERDAEVAAAVAENAAAAAAVKSRDNAPYDAPKINDPLVEMAPSPKAEKVDKRVLRGEALIAAEEEVKDMLAYPEYYAARDREVEELKALAKTKKEEAEAALLAKKHTYDAPSIDDPIVETIKVDDTGAIVDKKAIRADAKAFKKYNDERDAEVAAAVAANADALAALKAKNILYDAPSIDDPIVDAVKAEPEAPVGKKALRADAKAFKKYNDERDAEVAAAVAANAEALAALKAKNTPYSAPAIDDPIVEAVKAEPRVVSEKELRADAKAFQKYNDERDARVAEATAPVPATASEPYDAEINSWTAGSKGDLEFRIDAPYEKFRGLKIDGRGVDKRFYTARAGSTIIAVKATYLNALSFGEHSMDVAFTDRVVTLFFETQSATSTLKKKKDAQSGKPAVSKRDEQRAAREFIKYTEKRDGILEERSKEAAIAAASLTSADNANSKITDYGNHPVDEIIEETVASTAATPVATSDKRDERRAAREFVKYNTAREDVLAERARKETEARLRQDAESRAEAEALSRAIAEINAEDAAGKTVSLKKRFVVYEEFASSKAKAGTVRADARKERADLKSFAKYSEARDLAVSSVGKKPESEEIYMPYSAPAEPIEEKKTDAAPKAEKMSLGERLIAEEEHTKDMLGFAKFSKERDKELAAAISTPEPEIELDLPYTVPSGELTDAALGAGLPRTVTAKEVNDKALKRAIVGKDAVRFKREAALRDKLISKRRPAHGNDADVKPELLYNVPADQLDDGAISALTLGAREAAKTDVGALNRAAVGKDAVRYKKEADARDAAIAFHEKNYKKALEYDPPYEAPGEDGYELDAAINRELELLYPELGARNYTKRGLRMAKKELGKIERANMLEMRLRRRDEVNKLLRDRTRIENERARRERLEAASGISIRRFTAEELVLDKDRLASILKVSRERDTKYMKVRSDAKISELAFTKDTAKLDFTRRSYAEMREVRENRRELKRAKRNKPLAMRYEKADNERYYSFALENIPARYTGKDVGELLELRRQLVELIMRRDEINKRLIELYRSSENGKDLTAKGDKKEKRAQLKEHKRQKRLEYVMRKKRVDGRYRDALHDLMDEQVELEGAIARGKFTLRHEKPKGKALREEQAAIRKNKMAYARNRSIIKRMQGVAFQIADDRRRKNRDMIIAWLLLIGLVIGGFLLWWQWDNVIDALRTAFPSLNDIFPKQ